MTGSMTGTADLAMTDDRRSGRADTVSRNEPDVAERALSSSRRLLDRRHDTRFLSLRIPSNGLNNPLDLHIACKLIAPPTLAPEVQFHRNASLWPSGLSTV